ncbi:MAG: response regulator [Candidatus Omnitrophica bacterium]|nr:response regulator [Candidatus Omnitrophota bacterium]
MKKKILLIDDEAAFTSMLKLFLESTGEYNVAVENNPHRAVNAAEIHTPHLILLDVIMPELEGSDVADRIRQHPNLNKTPIIFLTATIREDEMQESQGVIADQQFIAKLSNTDFLIDSIEKKIALTHS